MVASEDWWEHRPGDRVVTTEGYPGVVDDVQDGPGPGAEVYTVTLDDGMGGGSYGAGELRATSSLAARQVAVLDPAVAAEAIATHWYPELGTALVDHPPPALSTTSSRREAGHFVNTPSSRRLEELASALLTEANATRWRPDHPGEASPYVPLPSGVLANDGSGLAAVAGAEPTCSCCAGTGEHDIGKECYACDGGGTLSLDELRSATIPCDGTIGTDSGELADARAAETSISAEGGWIQNLLTSPTSEYHYNWCRFRGEQDAHCYYPKGLDPTGTAQAGYAVWQPVDRGSCPRQSWQQQSVCPIGAPGPHAPGGLVQATQPWSAGGQQGGYVAARTTEILDNDGRRTQHVAMGSAKSKRTFSFTAPDGSRHEVPSSREFSHAVLIQVPEGHWRDPAGTWGVWSAHGTQALAESAAAKVRKMGPSVAAAVAVAPADEHEVRTAAGPRREPLSRVLQEFDFNDGGSWDHVRSNRFVDPFQERMRQDIAEHGVQRPVSVDYSRTPPRVVDGHTRLWHAEALGLTDVPVVDRTFEQAHPEVDGYQTDADDPDGSWQRARMEAQEVDRASRAAQEAQDLRARIRAGASYDGLRSQAAGVDSAKHSGSGADVWRGTPLGVGYDPTAPVNGQAPLGDESGNEWFRGDTDWDQSFDPTAQIHRGIKVWPSVHPDFTDLPDHEVAKHLIEHVAGHPRGGIGTSWTTDVHHARQAADAGTWMGDRYHPGDYRTSDVPSLRMIVHAAPPAREHIETDPAKLQHDNITNYTDDGESEVPLRQDAPVRVTGVSWQTRPGNQWSDWRHHQFATPVDVQGSSVRGQFGPGVTRDWPLLPTDRGATEFAAGGDNEPIDEEVRRRQQEIRRRFEAAVQNDTPADTDQDAAYNHAYAYGTQSGDVDLAHAFAAWYVGQYAPQGAPTLDQLPDPAQVWDAFTGQQGEGMGVTGASVHAAAETLDDLAHAGYCTDGWGNWQQGGCLNYVHALLRADPRLKAGALYDADGMESHFFAHDGVHAYDSAGKHLLPYAGVHGGLTQSLDEDLGWYDEPDEAEVAAAGEHATRNGILQGRYGLHGGHTSALAQIEASAAEVHALADSDWMWMG